MRASKRKKIPTFETEEAEKTFWKTHDSSDYLDWTKSERLLLPNLRPSLKTISLRLPESMIEELKLLAHKRDIPYQSLLKLLLSEKIREELKV